MTACSLLKLAKIFTGAFVVQNPGFIAMIRLCPLEYVVVIKRLMLCFVLLACAPLGFAGAKASLIEQWFAEHGRETKAQRVTSLTTVFLDQPYLLGALGEGGHGSKAKPLYRDDAFDCVTLTNTLLAMLNAQDMTAFKQQIKRVRYRDAKVGYIHRNHFISVDWNPNNTRNGFIEDVTHKIIDKHGKPIAAIADTVIDKPAWFKKQGHANLAKQTHAERSVLLYLPLSTLYRRGQIDTRLLQQIPDVAIIEIVRPNWSLRKYIGTNLNVSHLGIAFRQHGKVMFLNASRMHGKVEIEPLADYLARYLDSSSIKGINVQRVVL